MNKIIFKNDKINWICLADKCPHNCCGLFKTDKRRKSLWSIEEKLIPLTPEDYQIMAKSGYKNNLIKKKDGGWYIKVHQDGLCPFLKNNRCLIYEKCRVSSCKSYPFFFSKYHGLYADFSCPGWGKGWTSMKKVREMIKELIKVYEWQIQKAENRLGLNKN